ncbi:hypothetical protein [Sphingomonas sp. DT-204]|uniref:hypothetical protein n=1 Tax=Sphingomonas sp. DT-204 TaxID=3396166 RepID=UPI003F1ADB4D
MKKWMAMIAGCCLATAANAGALGGEELTVSRVTLENGDGLVEAVGMANPYQCEISNVAKLPTDPDLRDRYMSLAVTAMSANLKVTMWFDGCTSSPWGTVPRTYHLSVAK